MTLPAGSPWTIPPGRWSLGVTATWANSFSWTQDAPGETPEDRRFLVDGEALLLELTARRGLGRNLDAALHLPVHARGGGALDGFIDWWHRLVHVPDGDRPQFLKNAFRVEGLTTDGQPFSWNDETGGGLGNLEVEARYRVRDGALDSPSLALVGRLSLPTGTGPFGGHGPGAGAQLLAHVPLSGRFDLHTGTGFTVQDGGPVRDVAYVPARAHAFLALEWRPWRRVSLLAETNVASRLVDGIDSYPGVHWVVNGVGRIDLGERLRLDVGFTENLVSQLATTDFALYAGIGLRPN